jgi:hypothetical protein
MDPVNDFRLDRLRYKNVGAVEDAIEDGWIAQYRGRRIVSRMIQYATGGCHSHSAMLRRNGNGADVLDVREWVGGAARPLRSEVARYPGQIDVFAVDQRRWPEYCGRGAVRYMRELTGRDYGYAGIARLALQRIPGLRRLWAFDHDDCRESNAAPFCSHAVCAAERIGGGVDPVPRKPDDRVSPNDLTWSLLHIYQFTLIP